MRGAFGVGCFSCTREPIHDDKNRIVHHNPSGNNTADDKNRGQLHHPSGNNTADDKNRGNHHHPSGNNTADDKNRGHHHPSERSKAKHSLELKKQNPQNSEYERKSHTVTVEPSAAQTFTFKQLAAATKNFRTDALLGEGGFGRVYRGRLSNINKDVAIKQLDHSGGQGNREFLVEVLVLSLLDHPNLVNLIGSCAEGEQRLLVYEFMPLGSLEDHLHDLPPTKKPLDWNTRLKVACGTARGLEYLHDKANPPVIYRDLKCSNILLDEEYNPKLSDFGLAKLAPVGDKTHVSTRVMGTYGYCAPEYAKTGQLTLKSDIFSFGVVLLELITGRRALDNCRPAGERNLVFWARPLFKDRKKFSMMVDPKLEGQYPTRSVYQALAIAAMCVQDQPSMRPGTGDIVTALSYLASHTTHPHSHCNKKLPVNDTPLQSPKDAPHQLHETTATQAPQLEGGDTTTVQASA